MGIMIFLPFAVMVAISIPQIDPANWFVIRPDVSYYIKYSVSCIYLFIYFCNIL
jgi:hypothetical protein